MANPDYSAYCSQLWGWPEETDCNLFAGATNVVFGDNPPYQISDFLAVYPKFGTFAQAVGSVAIANGGTGYAVNDQLQLVQPDASGCIIQAMTVDSNGVILTAQIAQQGQGYSVAQNLAVTGGNGAGALFNVTNIIAANLIVPQAVLQMYVTLASASLQSARWCEMWPMAIALFIAHYTTLYLMSEGNTGSTAGSIARSGLAAGIIVSNTASNVSMTIEPPNLEEFGMWNLTLYGQQFASLAKTIGSGPMLLW
jgi:hypothetical protein